MLGRDRIRNENSTACVVDSGFVSTELGFRCPPFTELRRELQGRETRRCTFVLFPGFCDTVTSGPEISLGVRTPSISSLVRRRGTELQKRSINVTVPSMTVLRPGSGSDCKMTWKLSGRQNDHKSIPMEENELSPLWPGFRAKRAWCQVVHKVNQSVIPCPFNSPAIPQLLILSRKSFQNGRGEESGRAFML